MTGISVDRKRIESFCLRWGVSELAFFGSVLRKDFKPESDVDVLISFAPKADLSLFDMVRMQEELEKILGRRVDLSSRRAIESSRNHLRKKEILNSAQVVYAFTVPTERTYM